MKNINEEYEASQNRCLLYTEDKRGDIVNNWTKILNTHNTFAIAAAALI